MIPLKLSHSRKYLVTIPTEEILGVVVVPHLKNNFKIVLDLYAKGRLACQIQASVMCVPA